MASNNIILAVPSANSSVNYELPQSESAKLSFSPEDIDGLKLDASGGLVISFVEGGQVTLTNFQSFIDNGNTLSLADGTNVDPKLLFNALGGTNDNAFPTAASDAIKIDVPSANAQNEIKLEAGKKYLMNFDLSETTGANVKDGQMVIGFANGGKIVITNYETAMAEKMPPELSLASKTCVVTGDELITNIQKLAATEVVVEEKEEETKAKSKVADVEMQGEDNSGIVDPTKLGYKAEEKKAEAADADAQKVANVEPAAGEEADIARQLAQIETAAGPAGGAAGRAGGYGYGSRFAPDPFATNPDIGPINPTQLQYRAPILTPSEFIANNDDNPIAIAPGAQFVDETNLDNGPLVVSGGINIDFGADGPGGVSPNGSFSSGGSQTGGVLSANGQPITVTVVGNTYIGVTSGGDKVFELTIDPKNGDYTYTQYIAIDHADKTNPNDQIILNFGVTAKDGDGDSVSTKIQIVVADDAPVIEGSSASVDETDFGATISASGNLVHDYNQDGPGKIEATGSFTSGGSQKDGVLSAGGVPVTVTQTATGYEGKANGVLVFTLTINPSTGDYTYTQFKNLDHADGSNPNDEITLTFGAKITDYDGDTATAPIVITVVDDGPDFQSCGCGPKPDKGLEIVDETNLKNGPAIETGKLDADFGADAPGSYGFKDGSFTSSGSKTSGNLTHNGVPVVVTLVNGVWVGKAGNETIFTLELNTSTGDYKFTLYDNLDHANKTDPDDQIVLDFGVVASDFDGDKADGSIRIIVKDDGPVANDDINTYDTTFGVANGNVVTGLNGGPGAADVLSTDGWTATDSSNKVVKIAFGGNEVDVPETGTVSIDGQYGTLTIAADGTYTYKAFDNGGMIDHGGQKEFVSGPALPDFDEAEALDGVEQQSLGIAPGNLSLNGGETISVTFHSEGAGYNNSMGVFSIGPNGELKYETVLIKNGNTVAAGQTYSYTAGADATAVGFFIVANGADHGIQNFDLNTGTLNFVYDYGLPTQRDAKVTDDGSHIKLVYTDSHGATTVVPVPVYFTSDRGGMDNLNADDSVRVVSGIPGSEDHVLRIGFEDLPGLGDKDFNDMVFDVSITAPSCGCGDPDIKDEFVYTLQDGDGDQDKATLTLNGQDLTDDKPIFATPAVETVDETNLTGGAITETGAVTADFGHDGPGTFGTNGGFTSGGSKLNGNLTSGGEAVNVTLSGNTYTGKTTGGVTVFTLTIAANGSYTFKLFEQLDHADGTNPNDAITLNFGVDAIDCDGDKTGTTLTVKVLDDAPDAKDDTNSAGEGQTVTGNVKNNDVVGQDTPGTITKVVFGNQTFDLPANGSNVVITGQFGKLTINNTGAYSYTANTNNPNGVDTFTYTLKDSDGDTDTATLKINVTCTDDVPVITPSVETVDETNLSGGVITETGSVSANFGSDGPGSIAANGSFVSGGSKLGGNLTSGGQPVNVTLNGSTYEGKTANGTVIFTLQVGTNGSYTFKLFEQLDHADGTNPNDSISLQFGVTGTDADGDAVTSTITVNVLDDAPDAKDDGKTATEGQTVIGNVTNNDIVGQDVPGKVTKVSFGGQSYDLPANGSNITINGAFGKLTINNTGSYSYTANGNNPDGVDTFTYTLRDNDGDTDTAKLSFTVSSQDDCPIIVKPADEIVDETNLSGGVITETGTVSANYFGDGPGAITANGSFTSGGSKLGGNLTHQGQPVNVTLSGDTYTGKTANGTVIFTLQVASNGSYTFKLFEQLDHADGSNPNDIITLDFGVTATDADGDTASTTITVKVKDDAPDAKDDGNSVAESGTVTGNVTNNDVVGQDVPGKVTKISFNGQSYDVPVNGSNITINGAFGKLTINNTGAYSYTANSNNPNGTDQFTYTLRDNDGDTDTACLSISVSCNDDIPTITPAIETIDETNLAGGIITETGTVTATYGSDGPGAITANGSFTSGGSKLGGNLTHQGQPVNVTLSGDTYTGKTAGGVTVFTLQVGTNGNYTFKLFEQLDHADGSNPNDIITLDFGVTATDADGDSASTTITVKVKDDAPDAKDDGNSVAESGTVTGNVTSNDIVGQDVPGKVTKISFNGQNYDVPVNGSNITINGAFGKLTINNTGAYSYTANSNNPNGTDQFTYTLKDNDGDTDTACLSISVSCNDDVPVITPAIETIDETNLASGTITETGAVTVNYGADGPGTVTANGSFVSGGSKLGGQLTSGGSLITVSLSGDTYTGKTAGGVTVFTLKVATDGSYTFKLFEQLDHADGNNPNDIISLQFGVTATDSDSDTQTSTITVNVKDDAPDAKDDGNVTAETQTVTGNVTSNDIVGQDVPGKVTKVSFGGQSYDVPANGTNVVINGTHGTLTINNTGAYSYTAKDNTMGVDQFTYTLRDNDGDTDTACLSITVECGDDMPTITPAIETIDETNLASGVITETGTVTATYGNDGPGTITANGSFTSGGSKLGGNLTHQGQAVNVTLSGDTYTGKTAGGTVVFTLQVGTNGNYTFKLFEQLDHADGNNPNDIISLNFGVTATDSDGDAQTSTITVNVKDDAPDAKDDGNSVAESGTVTGNVTSNDIVGQDVPGKVTKISFGGQSYDVPVNGSNIVINGTYGKLTINNTGAYSYTANSNNPNGTDAFTYTLRDNDGDTDTACLSISVSCNDDVPVITPAIETIDETNLSGGTITETGSVTVNYGGDGPGTVTANGSFVSGGSKLGGNLTHQGQAVNVTLSGDTYTGKTAGGTVVFTLQVGTNGNYTFKLFEQLDHADGNNPNDIISLQFGVTATDSDGDAQTSTITVNVKDDAPDAKDDGNVTAETQTVTGNVTSNDIVGQDVPGTVTKILYNGQSYNVPTTGSLQIVGAYGTLNIDKTGAYSYTAKNNANGVDSFTYTLRDNDGDTDTACLTLTVTATDDCPTITPAVETIDETNLSGGTITETGNVTANYGGDGPGAITANGSFTSGGSKLNGNLTHNGQPVSVSLSGNTYTGTTAGGTTIFTLVVAANGSYTFKLFEQLDHADGTNPNDIISLNFGVTATDADGDTANATITVNVKDDAPIANDDSRQMVNGTSTINGNVTDNDVVGQDTPGNVTKISFNGTTKDVPATGTVSIAGTYGTLVIDHTGAYTYTAKPGATGTDSFTYILKDNDGDTDPACLSIEVKPNPLVVCIFADDQCVKEDGHVGVPVNAYFTGASGNETMTITLTGVPAGWTITAPGWTLAGGVYTLTLPQGVTTWNGTVDFKPPANSDVDLNGLIFKASVYDPDNSSTTFATEDVNIVVDAVVEPFTFKTTVNGTEDTSNINFFLVTNQAHTERYQLSIKDVTHTDTDGSESIKKVIFTLEHGMDPQTYIAVQNPDGSFSKVGVKGADGADTTYTIDLTGMTYAQALDYLQNKLYLVSDGNSYLDGGYDLDITVVKYEKNLSGIEKDYSDNETSYTVTKQINYCLSPLVIDLDRDGVELLSKEHGVAFDMTNDGVKDHTGWVAKDDALLVLDRNKDGLINDRSELFGNDENYANGFESLRAFDSNNDGVIDSKDAVFSELRVWQDLNSDGISQANEMRSLHDVNIAAIQLGATETNYQIAGNSISHESKVIYGDGSDSAIVDAWFAYDNGASAGVDKGLTVAAPVTAVDAPDIILVDNTPVEEAPAPDIIVVADTGTKSGNELPTPTVDNGPEPVGDLPKPTADNGPTPAGNDDQPGVPCGYDPFWGWDGKLGGLEDKFLFQTISQGADSLKDLHVSKGEKVDLSGIISDFDPVTDAINDFVFAKDTGEGHTISSDGANGGAEAVAHQFAVADTGNVNVTDLFNNGSIIV